MSSIRLTGVSFSFVLPSWQRLQPTFFVTIFIGEINRHRKEDNQSPYFGDTPPKVLRIFRKYSRLYPNGKLRHYYPFCF